MDSLPDKPIDTPSSAPPTPPNTTPPSTSTELDTPPPGPTLQPLTEFLAHSSRLSAQPRAQPMYAPNRVLPRFIRLLAVYVFVIGGTLGAATAGFYQYILYPRLVARVEMLTKLYQHGLVNYDALATRINTLATAKLFSLISLKPDPGSVLDQSTALDQRTGPERDQALVDAKSGLLDGDQLADPIDPRLVATPPAAAPSILTPLRESLHQLAAIINPLPNPTPSTSVTTSSTSSASLSSTLSILTSFIDTQNAVASSMAYKPYIGYSPNGTAVVGQGLSQDQVELKEAVTTFKATIRTVKGALLNRRNFAALPPRGEGIVA